MIADAEPFGRVNTRPNCDSLTTVHQQIRAEPFGRVNTRPNSRKYRRIPGRVIQPSRLAELTLGQTPLSFVDMWKDGGSRAVWPS